MIVLIALILSACGKESQSLSEAFNVANLKDSECQIKDSCTHANVAGYVCETVRYNVQDRCVITKQDFQTDPHCDPSHPNATCSSGAWGGKQTSFPCCQTIQGPGPAATP
jgi:hypothetical protein